MCVFLMYISVSPTYNVGPTYVFLFLAHFYAGGEKIAYLHVQDGVTIEKGPVNGDGRRPPVNTVQILYKYHTNTVQILNNNCTNI